MVKLNNNLNCFIVNREVDTSISKASNTSASATITITMTGILDE